MLRQSRKANIKLGKKQIHGRNKPSEDAAQLRKSADKKVKARKPVPQVVLQDPIPEAPQINIDFSILVRLKWPAIILLLIVIPGLFLNARTLRLLSSRFQRADGAMIPPSRENIAARDVPCFVDLSSNPQESSDLSSQDKQRVTQQVYNEVCTDTSIETYNKPDITLGIFRGLITPKSCVVQDKSVCHGEAESLTNFAIGVLSMFRLGNQRVQTQQSMETWKYSIEPEISNIQKDLSMEQRDQFDAIMSCVRMLKAFHIVAVATRISKGGNCGEITNTALVTLLSYKLRYGLEMKIQQIILNASRSINSITDHTFLLLDSDIDDVAVMGDAAGVRSALDKITKGKICDPWNHGYLHDFQNDDSGFYSHLAGWDSLAVRTYRLDFSEFKNLSAKAQRFICVQLVQMGFTVEPEGECRMFGGGESSDGRGMHRESKTRQEL